MNRIIPFSLAQPGMVLAEVAAIDGQVLLAVGTVLTAAHIGMLEKRGVRSLTITQAKLQAGLGARQILELDRELRPRFVRCDMQHPVIKEVYRLALMRRVQQAMQGRSAHVG
jgi:hypothetical protein